MSAPNSLAASGRSGQFPFQGSPSSAKPRFEDSFDLIKREFELLVSENNLLRQQRDDSEHKLNQQLHELNVIRSSIAQLESQHLQVRQQYEREIQELQKALNQQQNNPTPRLDHKDDPLLFKGRSSAELREKLNAPSSLSEPLLSASSSNNTISLPPLTSPRTPFPPLPSRRDPLLPSPSSNHPKLFKPEPRQPPPSLLSGTGVGSSSPLPIVRQPTPQIPPKSGWRWDGIDLAHVPPQCRGGDPNSDWFTIYDDPEWKQSLDIKLAHTLCHPSVVCCVRFSADGRFLATGCNHTAQIFDVNTGVKICSLQDDSVPSDGSDLYVRSVCFSPDGKLLATGTEDRVVRVWEIAKKRVRVRFPGHTSEIYSLQFSADGKSVVSASGDGTVRIWDLLDRTHRILSTTGVPSAILTNPRPNQDNGITSVSLSPTGMLIATGSLDNTIKIWDAVTCDLIETLEGHASAVYSVAFVKDGKGLISASLDRTMKYWDVSGLMGGGVRAERETGDAKKAFTGHADFVLSVVVSSNSRWFASGSKDRSVMFWDITSGQAMCLLQGHKNSVISLDLDPSNRLLATGSGDSNARIWKFNAPL